MKAKSSKVEQRRRKSHKKDAAVRSNPFELRINKQKFAIIGRKSKNDKGLPGLSRSKAIKKRKATLLQEYKHRNKVSSFVDKRFGEYDTELSLEERMLKRFTLEKQKHHESKKLYNLDDDEELTHYGQSLGEMTSFDDADLQLTDDENEEDRTEADNFGGFLKKVDKSQANDEGDKQKSKKEIMEDIVAKSKLKKFERQQAKEEAFQLTQDLDSDWKMIHSLLQRRDDTEMTKADDYDILVNELKYETKAKPKERMKTEEEIAKAEKEKLEKLEAERLERMRLKEASKSPHLSADYLGDSHVVKSDNRIELTFKDGKAVLPQGMFEIGKKISGKKQNQKSDIHGDDEDRISVDDDDEGSEEDSEEDGDDDSDEDEEDEEDGSDDEDEDVDDEGAAIDDDEEDENEVENLDENRTKELKTDSSKDLKDTKSSGVADTDKIEEIPSKELPFTFPAPNNLDQLLATMDGWPYEDQLCILDRIRKCHPAKLEEKNKKKMEIFFDVILKYIDHLCEQETVPFFFINKLAKPLFAIVKDCPHHCASEIQRRLRDIFKKFWMRCQTAGGRNAMPSIKEVILLNIVAKIFPTSDMKHGITSPALTYMAAVLSKAYFNSAADLISGLFVSNLILEFVSLSKRFVPETVNFLTGIISLAANPDNDVKYKLSLRLLFKNRHCLYLKEKTDEIAKKICVSDVETRRKQDLKNLDVTTRISILRNCIHLAKEFAELYKELPSFTEIFEYAKQLIDAIPSGNYPKEIKKEVSELLALLNERKERQHLTMLARKPVPLPLLEPKFDESYEIKSKKRSKDKDANERNKLKYKHKSEMKGAIREIRKDSQFLAKEKLEERIQRDKERTLKTKEIERQLGEQQGELKALNKMKRKKR